MASFLPFALLPENYSYRSKYRQTHLKVAWTFPLFGHLLSVRPQPFLTLKRQKCKTSSFKPVSRHAPPRWVPSTAHAVTTAEQKPTCVMGMSSRHRFSLIFSTDSGCHLPVSTQRAGVTQPGEVCVATGQGEHNTDGAWNTNMLHTFNNVPEVAHERKMYFLRVIERGIQSFLRRNPWMWAIRVYHIWGQAVEHI